ncbi:10564_t:CDS:2 [Funneliformis caledonium]|uniref:10564_t:CDS:1 n=1 Tax=Funneliformis caledonium TaxID=1117310 RepID=A0A9N9HWK4_9GLOM|nr:10564_t:CDS:2 [Funneliformis caledonium]
MGREKIHRLMGEEKKSSVEESLCSYCLLPPHLTILGEVLLWPTNCSVLEISISSLVVNELTGRIVERLTRSDCLRLTDGDCLWLIGGD